MIQRNILFPICVESECKYEASCIIDASFFWKLQACLGIPIPCFGFGIEKVQN